MMMMMIIILHPYFFVNTLVTISCLLRNIHNHWLHLTCLSACNNFIRCMDFGPYKNLSAIFNFGPGTWSTTLLFFFFYFTHWAFIHCGYSYL